MPPKVSKPCADGKCNMPPPIKHNPNKIKTIKAKNIKAGLGATPLIMK